MVLSGGVLSGGVLSGGVLSGGVLSRRVLSRGGFVTGGFCPAGYCPGGFVQGGFALESIIDMMYVVDQSKECPQIYLPKNACCLNLQLPILFFKSIISDMHHHNRISMISYMTL